jgi:hypothetical protein
MNFLVLDLSFFTVSSEGLLRHYPRSRTVAKVIELNMKIN